MPQLLPPTFLFRYSFPVKYESSLPRRGEKLVGLSSEYALPELGSLDGRQRITEIRSAWNERGLALAVSARDSKKRPSRLPPRTDDWQFQVWIDTRCTQNVHRATRYCHQFGLLGNGGGVGGVKPTVRQLAIARAREDAPRCDLSKIQAAAQVSQKRFELEAWFPSTALHGFDPEANSRLGFYYQLSDVEDGDQFLAMSKEFPFANDPSLWSILELAR
jgi:hypothetical protein